MMGLRQQGHVHRSLITTLGRQQKVMTVLLYRQLSILQSPRRHCHHSWWTSPIGKGARCVSIDSTSSSTPADTILASSSSHVPIEPMAWYNPAQYIMDVSHLIHDTTGWPYATSIILITAMGRMALFPLMVSSQRVRIKMEDIQNVLVRFSKTKPNKLALQAKQKALRKQYGYHPSQLFTLPLANVALTMYMWFGLRWMGYYYPDEMSTGGILWFTDLTTSDPLYLLPILSGTCSILMFEVGAQFRTMSKNQKLFGRTVAFAFVPILMYAPASVHIFWTSNWLMSAVQDVVISQPAVRETLGLVRPSERTKDETIVFIKDVETRNENDKEEEELVEAVGIKSKRTKKGPKHRKKR